MTPPLSAPRREPAVHAAVRRAAAHVRASRPPSDALERLARASAVEQQPARKAKKSKPQQSKPPPGGGRLPGTPPRQWVDTYHAFSQCDVSPAEYDAALAAARADLLRGKRPAAGTPHLLLTIGAPGAGKSTVSAAVAARGAPGADYVEIDLDVAVRYHPRYRDLWLASSAVSGRPTDVGFTLTYLACNETLESLLVRIYDDIVFGDGPKYNIIFQSHAHTSIIYAKAAGYRVSLLFVGVPLAVAQARSRRRAATTGKFLAPNLAAQDELVEDMWSEYRLTASWYGMWADEFLVVDNRGPPGSPVRPAEFKPRCAAGSWDAGRKKAHAAVLAACAP